MKELVGYITSSYPSNTFTIDLVMSMKEAGLDRLELGIPFSDPVADGPVIEELNYKALSNGFKLDNLFSVSKKLSKNIDIYWMGYMNPIYQNLDRFLQNGKEFGIKGFIIPDLPYEEAILYKDKFNLYNQTIIDFVAPTTTKDRIKMVVSNSKEFIYLVAYAGITGSGKKEDLSNIVQTIKQYTNTKIFVGFGVNEKTAKEKSKNVDGVIVGSAFIKVLSDNCLSSVEKIKKISNIVKIIKNEINDSIL